MRGRLIILMTITFLLLVTPILAEKKNIIINSKEWRDVYSGLIYGKYVEKQPSFLTSEPHSLLILNSFNNKESITVLSSKQKPFVYGYESTIRNRGYEDVEETIINSVSLELAKDLENINKYIVIDDSYGYNAIAIAPYALLTNSYVLFADRTNIVEIEDFLETKNPEKILIYGHVDREVTNRLEKFSPEIINEDGDRFANNVEIVKKFMEIKKTGQVMLTNGEYIEESLISDQFPTLFIGKNNVPDKIKEYVINSDINTGVLIGNDLVGTATVIRRQLGISVFVKFARSARAPAGPINQIEDLDLFAVPKVELNLTITNAHYNRLTGQIEITYKNSADVVTYFKGSYTIIEGDNQQSFGDLEPIFIASNSFKTIVYDVEPIVTESATLDIYTIFGESKNSLEFILDGSFPISMIDIKDEANIEFVNVFYDKVKERFSIEIQNTGDKEVFVDTEIIDIIIQSERVTLSSEEIINIKPGKKKKSLIPATLDDQDIEDNPTIRVRSYFGERENALVKIKEGVFELAIREATLITYLPTILLIIIIILLFLRLTKKKCPECGYKNPKKRKTCKKCKAFLK